MAEPRAQRAAGDDPVRVDSKHYKVEFENDKVRILRIEYGPNEKSVMHSHPPTVAIFLGPGHFRFTYPDGKTEEKRVLAGQSLYFEAMTHLPENLEDKRLEAILVELKS